LHKIRISSGKATVWNLAFKNIAIDSSKVFALAQQAEGLVVQG
jgi:hypothetical protein